MVVTGCIDIAVARAATDPDKAHKMLERARAGAAEIEAYAAKLPSLAGQPSKGPSPLPLHRTVPVALPPLTAGLPEGVTLVVESAADTGVVNLERERLETLLNALVTNAAEALPNGGEILVRTRNVAVGPRPERSDLRPGLYAVLEVHDRGIGMDAEVRDHLFEPYFTTKKGDYRGLGLCRVYGIAVRANGAVWVESEAGRGTIVQVHLPLVDAPTPTTTVEDRPLQKKTASPRNGDHTVLLVDDDATVREIVHDILVDAGYAVLVASAGLEALGVARGHDGPIDLLLTDVIMPGMDGLEAAQRFREIRPGTRVLFMSGYAEDVLRSVGSGKLEPFLPKPFPPETLRRKLAEVLSA